MADSTNFTDNASSSSIKAEFHNFFQFPWSISSKYVEK